MEIITFGCRLNTFESAAIQELAEGQLENTIIINTCAVTAEAERQCRQAIRRTARLNPNKKIIVTGCAAQLHPDLFKNMPEVSRVLGNQEKLSSSCLLDKSPFMVGDLTSPSPIPPLIHHFDGRNRAFLQIQQGCDHACTFCIVHKLRGKNIGLSINHVLKQAQVFVQLGFSEIVLTGVDITSYPYDFCVLIKRLLSEVKDLKRLRLGSLDPAYVDERLIDLLVQYPNLMPSFHLSVQSGDNLILKRMGRRHTRENVISFSQQLRKAYPLATLGADIITGFPTETEDQFQKTLDLILEADITHPHIFPYSARVGTPAARMAQVPKSVRIARAEKARLLGGSIYQKWLDKMVGQNVSILVEQNGLGYTENYIPVRVNSLKDCGKIITARVCGKEQNELVI